MSKLKRCALLLILALSMSVVPRQAEAAPPLRAGDIIGGWFPFAVFLAPGGTPSCSWNVDCIAWLESGCQPALAGRDPGVFSSIVNVRKLAGSTKQRMFRAFPGAAGIMWGGIGIEFWSRDCREIQPDPWIPVDFDLSGVRFKIPKGVTWMTISTVDDTTFHWQLY